MCEAHRGATKGRLALLHLLKRWARNSRVQTSFHLEHLTETPTKLLFGKHLCLGVQGQAYGKGWKLPRLVPQLMCNRKIPVQCLLVKCFAEKSHLTVSSCSFSATCGDSHPIWFCELNFLLAKYFPHAKTKIFQLPSLLLQNCPTAKKLLFVRGSSWPVTLTRDNVFVPCYTTCLFYLEHLNMKITLKVSTRRETNGPSSRLVDKTRTDVRMEFSGKFVAKMKTAKFEDNCQIKTLTDVLHVMDDGWGGKDFKFV